MIAIMFLENGGRDERQVVNWLSEFRGHASRSNGHEANSGSGGRNLHRAIGPLGEAALWLPVERRMNGISLLYAQSHMLNPRNEL
jgi:hypothetical protein